MLNIYLVFHFVAPWFRRHLKSSGKRAIGFFFASGFTRNLLSMVLNPWPYCERESSHYHRKTRSAFHIYLFCKISIIHLLYVLIMSRNTHETPKSIVNTSNSTSRYQTPFSQLLQTLSCQVTFVAQSVNSVMDKHTIFIIKLRYEIVITIYSYLIWSCIDIFSRIHLSYNSLCVVKYRIFLFDGLHAHSG